MKRLLVISIMFCAVSNTAFAMGYDPGAINQQYVRDLRTHEAITRARTKANNAIVTTKTQPKTEEQIVASDIKSIKFVNNVSIPSSQLEYIVKDKIGLPMTNENISAIRKDVMRYYQNQGFFSAIVMMTSQDTANGELVFDVKEGGRNSIQIEY